MNFALGQPRATQSAMQVTLTPGGFVDGSMHLIEQVSISRQPIVWQSPQSWWQLVHVSYGASHLPLPQTAHTPQSCAHEAHVSGGVQRPSPQPGHLPQSSGHVKQSSLDLSQILSPQLGHTPQSGAHVSHVSLPLQKPSPHVEQLPQSSGQELQLSPAPHVPSPHPAQMPQSIEHVVHDSSLSHTLLPQLGGSTPPSTSGPETEERSTSSGVLSPHAAMSTTATTTSK
jgi:hypothetical protein